MPRIFTRTGDSGTSALYDGSRRPKNDIVFQTLGEMDELTSRLGALKVQLGYKNTPTLKYLDRIHELLEQIQYNIQLFNSQIATQDPVKRKTLPELPAEIVTQLEVEITSYENAMPPLTKFILPGGLEASCRSHLCRTQTRRAERFLIALESDLSPEIKSSPEWDIIRKYMNRLSDFFFSLARYLTDGTE